MLNRVLPGIVLLALANGAQAGAILSGVLNGQTGIVGMDGSSRGVLETSPGTVLNSSAFRTAGANSILPGEVIAGVVKINTASVPGNLDVIYSLTVKSITVVSSTLAYVDFTPTTASDAYSVQSVLSASLQAQAPGVNWNNVGFAVVEGGTTDPTAVTGLPATGTPQQIMQAVGGSPTLDLLGGFATSGSFYLSELNPSALQLPSVKFADVFGGLQLMVNNSGINFVSLPVGVITNPQTGAMPGNDQLSVFGSTVSYSVSSINQNWSFQDNTSFSMNIGPVPEPPSVIVWSLMATGAGLGTVFLHRGSRAAKFAA